MKTIKCLVVKNGSEVIESFNGMSVLRESFDLTKMDVFKPSQMVELSKEWESDPRALLLNSAWYEFCQNLAIHSHKKHMNNFPNHEKLVQDYDLEDITGTVYVESVSMVERPFTFRKSGIEYTLVTQLSFDDIKFYLSMFAQKEYESMVWDKRVMHNSNISLDSDPKDNMLTIESALVMKYDLQEQRARKQRAIDFQDAIDHCHLERFMSASYQKRFLELVEKRADSKYTMTPQEQSEFYRVNKILVARDGNTYLMTKDESKAMTKERAKVKRQAKARAKKESVRDELRNGQKLLGY